MPSAHAIRPSALPFRCPVPPAFENRLPGWLPLSAIEEAADRISGHIVRTPLLRTPSLGPDLWIKAESFQATGAFKERGALNRLLRLSAAERTAGVIAMSAGNHAAGIALHAARLGARAVIVMPETAPRCKVERCLALGAEVILSGARVEEARTRALEVAAARGLTFIHPYDDPDVIAGQGTLGLELLDDLPELDTLVVPVGGGGLLAGVAAAVKALKPSVRVVGVRLARRAGPTLADGIAVAALGALAREAIGSLADALVEVEEAEVAAAVRALHGAGLVAEGAGAAATAAILAGKAEAEGRTVAVLSGRNVDSDRLARTLLDS
ncbi:pyridoxal-phosphate dependent enzyme [Azospirillum sp. SYSU D00513]|uniref:pyridoxal-phosphate dependent enzyme n=1 Tax=Azospirillum sp. SYSU D00513 TaxID=2812561 RepID=UPI001A97BA9A|nr:pyridoxal-phosphate dependent enzyme [Azospirillum sp. SYSU D00513]